jgi:hypothetical protein
VASEGKYLVNSCRMLLPFQELTGKASKNLFLTIVVSEVPLLKISFRHCE